MCRLHTTHSVFEKSFFRFFIYGTYVTGAWAIFKANEWFALFYACFAGLSLIWVARRFCSNCPYPCNYSDCLMIPYTIGKLMYTTKPRSMNVVDRMSFPVIMLILLPLIPQYWLFQDHALLVLFWFLYITAWSTMLVFKCRHCRFNDCPLNITKRMI